MKKNMQVKKAPALKGALAATVAIAALAISAAASAQTAGTWAVGVGYNNVSPTASTDPISPPSLPNSTTKVSSNGQPIAVVDYMVTDHFSLEFGIGTPYKHKMSGDGALAGVGQLGTFEQLPPTLFAQYRFLDANSPLRPYVGIGLTYAIFRDEKGSGTLTAVTDPGGAPATFKIDNTWAPTPEVGLTYAFNKKWYGDVRVSKTYLDPTVHINPTNQTTKAPLNPISSALVIGYRF
ncbi:MAG: OmpW family protein [Burkholderiaceae bacterium]|nr:OmpW family protein [Burkholderiaceae bacterium]